MHDESWAWIARVLVSWCGLSLTVAGVWMLMSCASRQRDAVAWVSAGTSLAIGILALALSIRLS